MLYKETDKDAVAGKVLVDMVVDTGRLVVEAETAEYFFSFSDFSLVLSVDLDSYE